jgi:hypothetical protein
MLRDIRLLKSRFSGAANLAAMVAVAAALSGCAIVEAVRSDGTYERSIALAAPLVIAPAPTGESSVVRITGLGLGGANNTGTLGWFDETVATLGPDCRVVLIGNTDQQLERFAALLPKNETICGNSKLNGGQK